MFLFPIGALLIGTFKHDRAYLAVPRRSIAQGVTAREVGTLPVLLLRQGDDIRAVVAALPPNHRVVVCATASGGQVLVDADTGQRFGLDGAGLQQVLVTRAGANIRIYPEKITAAPGQAVFRAQATGPWDDQALHPDPALCPSPS